MTYKTRYNAVSNSDMFQTQDFKSTNGSKSAFATIALVHTKTDDSQITGHLLRRFYFRGVVGVLGPLVVISYFISVWYFYLRPAKLDDPVAFGPVGAKWIYYGWFVAGVIGLNLSLYGLEGVEAAMMMEPGWAPNNGTKLMMHADKTWSGPGGWFKTIRWIWIMNRRGASVNLPSALWFVLALPSMLVFTAYPLSGLTMEMSQGYLHGAKVDGGPMMTGFSYANFNERLSVNAMDGARITWKNALDASIPGFGALYTAKGYDRSKDQFLSQVPAVLPGDEGLRGIFLSAQAANPIEGNSWGLLLQYDCSIIDDISDFRILSQRNASAGKFRSTSLFSYPTNDGSATITAKNQTEQILRNWAENIGGVMEYGYESWPNRETSQRLRKEVPLSTFTVNTACYFNKVENVTGDYPGIDQEQLFEVMLWQHLYNISRSDPKPNYNFTLDHNITGAHGAYDWQNFFFDNFPAERNNTAKYPPIPMSAIGVQCKASSSVGTADIDGVTSSWSNFIRTDTPINVPRARCADRFSGKTPIDVMTEASSKEWLSSLFSSVAAPPPFYQAQSTDPNDIDVGAGSILQLSYLQAEQLRKSMLRAYAAYAVQLMYNGGQGFTTADGSHIGFQNPNVTEFVSGLVLTRGVVPAEIPIALFAVWALFGPLMGVMYGFRRRWSAILDGYTMFRLGADLSDEVRARFAGYTHTLEVEDCVGLGQVPGLVGDVKVESRVGRIGLVDQRGVARKGRLYE